MKFLSGLANIQYLYCYNQAIHLSLGCSHPGFPRSGALTPKLRWYILYWTFIRCSGVHGLKMEEILYSSVWLAVPSSQEYSQAKAAKKLAPFLCGTLVFPGTRPCFCQDSVPNLVFVHVFLLPVICKMTLK